MNNTKTKQKEIIIPIPTFLKTDYRLALNNSTNYVFLGANGSGKSKLGIFIEAYLLYEIDKPVLRINAQKMLSITDKVNIMDHKEAKRQLEYGGIQPYISDTDCRKQKARSLYVNGQFANPQSDFPILLSALFSQHQEIANKFLQDYKKNPSANLTLPKSSALDELKKLWTKLLPGREFVTDGYNISIKQNGRIYKPMYMSDGEKVLLYLIGQCLLVPNGATIIIDEPEVHVNRSILSKLWDLLEEYRKDCIFIYITQDSDFALSRVKSQKIWVKNCNFHIDTVQKTDKYSKHTYPVDVVKNQEWELEEITQNNLPEDLLLSLLGNKKKILFIEGKQNSLDKRIYEYAYPDFTIVPCGGCGQVAKMYSAHKVSLFAHIKSFAIIDRDRKSDEEITKLKEKGLEILDFVTEIENVLLLPEILKLAIVHLGKDENLLNQIQEYIFEEYNNESKYEIAKNTVYELNYKINSLQDITEKLKDLHEIQSDFTQFKNKISDIDIEKIYNSNKQKVESIYMTKNYLELLKIMNSKNMPDRISTLIGLNTNDYKEFVLNQLKKNEKYRNDFVKILKNYFPKLD